MMADCSDGGNGAGFPRLADGKLNLAGPASGGVMVGMTYLCVTVAPTNAERIETWHVLGGRQPSRGERQYAVCAHGRDGRDRGDHQARRYER